MPSRELASAPSHCSNPRRPDCGGKPVRTTTSPKNRMNSPLAALATRISSRIAEAAPTGPAIPIPQPRPLTDDEFNTWLLELAQIQEAHNPVLRAFQAATGTPAHAARHWTQLAALPTAAFKEFAVSCLDPADRTRRFRSSGTTASQCSIHHHCDWSLATYEASLLPWFKRHLLNDPLYNPPELLFLTPNPTLAPESSLVHMLDAVRRSLGQPTSVFTGLLDSNGAWIVDPEAIRARLDEAVDSNRPLLIAGTAFNFVHWLEFLESRRETRPLPPGSRLMETGGYKGRSRELSKDELHHALATRFQLPRTSIVCEYGMSELSSQAYDLRLPAHPDTPRVFRLPPWARARIISPETQREVAPGERGLLQIADLANVASCCLLQTEDLAVRLEDGFALAGRATAARAKGCSLLAA